MVSIKTIVKFQVFIVLVSTLAFLLLSSNAILAAASALIGGIIGSLPHIWFGWRLQMLTVKMATIFKSDRLISNTSAFKCSPLFWIVLQLVKIAISLFLFLLVAVLFNQVQWVPLLLTYFLSLKIYWLAFLWSPSK